MTRNEAVKPGAIRAQRQLKHFKRLSEIYLLLPVFILFLGGFWRLGTFFFFPSADGTWHQAALEGVLEPPSTYFGHLIASAAAAKVHLWISPQSGKLNKRSQALVMRCP